MLSALDPRGLFISGETLLMRVRRLKRSTGWSSARFVGMGAVKIYGASLRYGGARFRHEGPQRGICSFICSNLSFVPAEWSGGA
ncbi:hypothetical protein Bca4012_031533 [Brassica carinata]|uniref:(rape) hypothetical protein n=1 Tax=Brassica napus TaxID=3708 RepID=A0A816JJM2_BRANA|nr:unnamed protein product [Brassica napus]